MGRERAGLSQDGCVMSGCGGKRWVEAAEPPRPPPSPSRNSQLAEAEAEAADAPTPAAADSPSALILALPVLPIVDLALAHRR